MPSNYMSSHFYGFSAIENRWETSDIGDTVSPLGFLWLNNKNSNPYY